MLGPKATIGTMYINGKQECYTLEDVVRLDNPDTAENEGTKIYGKTAIPAGRYQVIINTSPRLQKRYCRLLNVPGFDGILIHSGNDDEDTSGCIILGHTIDNDDYIHGGSQALPVFQTKVQEALNNGEQVWITINNTFLI